MRVDELISKMRLRLRDVAMEWWSDAELHDNINIALAAISHRLMPWKGRWLFAASSGIDTYSIPEDFMAPISLFLDGVMVPIWGEEAALRSESAEICGFIDNDSLIISPVPMYPVSIMLNYHCLEQTATVADVIKLPTQLIDVAMVYALSLSLQKQASEESLSQSKYYLDLYESRVRDVTRISHLRRNAPTNRSHFQKV